MAANAEMQTIDPSSSTKTFATWTAVYDEQVNPLLLLEERYLAALVPDIQGLAVLDVGCGTGRWLTRLAGEGVQRLTGIDPEPGMLERASKKLAGTAELLLGHGTALPVGGGSADVVFACFVLSYIEDLHTFARELRRVIRPNGKIFISDVHPDTMLRCAWRRSFRNKDGSVRLNTYTYPLETVVSTFEVAGFTVRCLLEPPFGEAERQIMRDAGKSRELEAVEDLAPIYILQLDHHEIPTAVGGAAESFSLRVAGASVVLGPQQRVSATIDLVDGCIGAIRSRSLLARTLEPHCATGIDLRGYLLFPGLINAHDHLDFGLFPNLGDGPYQNYLHWAADIHRGYAELIRRHQQVPKAARLWWGAIRNLLCGVTTVCHHNQPDPALLSPDFPIRVIIAGWAHSLQLDSEASAKYDSTPPDEVFVLHAAEGYDEVSAEEIFELDRLGMLSPRTILVHALALGQDGIALVNRRGASVVWCPTSNQFLFERTHAHGSVASLNNVVLGSDSPLTAVGDLLDEVRFAHGIVKVDAATVFCMISDRAARVFRLRSGEGTLRPGAVADVFAVRDRGEDPAQRLVSLSHGDVELVLIGGRVQLSSPEVFERLPGHLRKGLEPIEVGGHLRWVRAEVDKLIEAATNALGPNIRLGKKPVRYVCSA